MVVRAHGLRAAVLSALSVGLLLTGAAVGLAQTPSTSAPPPPAAPPKPITGFVPSYEIMRTVRAAGFQPLEPPMREGRIYVLRATDFRGILMHVVLDARTGAIRDVTPIVGPYGRIAPPGAPEPYGPPPYAAPPYAPPSYETPAEYGAPGPQIGSEDPGVIPVHPGIPPTGRYPSASTRSHTLPLPRPRPVQAPPKSEAAAQPADDAHAKNAARVSVPVTSGTTKTAPVPPLND